MPIFFCQLKNSYEYEIFNSIRKKSKSEFKLYKHAKLRYKINYSIII